jgi:phycocyanobilin:ferredoxin oxidoreductase
LDIVESYVEIHCKQAVASEPVSAAEGSKILEAQIYYCTQQQQNDKTRRVLEKAFGQDWAEHYMTEVLFDVPK